MSSSVFLTLLLLLLSSEINFATSRVYYITPELSDRDDFCKENEKNECMTFSEFSEIPARNLDSNSSLVLLPGKHFLENEIKLTNIAILDMSSSEFGSSRATIYCQKSSRFSFDNISHLLISDLDFIGCHFSLTDSTGRLEIVNSTFTGSNDSSTVLLVNHSSVFIKKSSFVSNAEGNKHGLAPSKSLLHHRLSSKQEESKFDSVLVGGAIVATRQSNVSISECYFKANSAPLGGAIFAEHNSQIVVNHSIFTASGHHKICGHDAICSSAPINNISLATHNITLPAGGAVFLHHSSLTAYKCSFHGNTASTGGAILAYGSNIRLSNCQMKNNTAGYNHSLQNPQANATDSFNGYSSTNTSSGCGGALFIINSHLSINKCVFINNKAYANGGAIHAESGSIQLHKSNFSHNIAYNGKGGALCANNSKLDVGNSQFSHNTANDTGGAVYGLGRNMSKNANTSTSNVVSESRLVSLFIYGSTFVNNSALYGGAMYSYGASLTVWMVSFEGNAARENGGAIMLKGGEAEVVECNFTQNRAHNGGGISSVDNSSVSIKNSTFAFNNVTNDAGCISGEGNRILILNSIFRNNIAKWAGAVALYRNTTITIIECLFTHNSAKWGGALSSYHGKLTLNRSNLSNQNALVEGGAVYSYKSILIIVASIFSNNRVEKDGGALAGISCRLSLNNSVFNNNEAKYYGSAMHWKKGTINAFGELIFNKNRGEKGVVYLYDTTANFTGTTTFKQNHGSLYTFSSRVTFTGNTSFINCSSIPLSELSSRKKRTVTNEISKLEGGALTITFESTIIFNGQCSIINNHAKVGGAFIVTESKVYLNGYTLIANNFASDTGGGVYLYQSELMCKQKCELQISNNYAAKRGGGFHAFSSLIKVTNPSSTILFSENEAENGGGICLEMDTKIYVLKNDANSSNAISFIGNSATNKGGAIHVIDGPHTCTILNALPYITNECFLQTIEQYDIQPSYLITGNDITDSSIYCTVIPNEKSVYFLNNNATSGPSIYGGLITSCTISHHKHSETDYNRNAIAIVNGTSYLSNISNIELSSISSDPIQICTCRNGWPDCSYQPCPIKIMKGGSFTVSVAAVDQANQPISATVYSSFRSAENDLTKHQFNVNENNNAACTNLTFFSTASGNSSDELILHVKGPCKEMELSKHRIEIVFYSCSECPIGFEPLTSSTRCECTCDSDLEPFVTRCNSSTATITRESNFWLAYLNDSYTAGYLFYQYCPLDYCLPPNSELDLNIDNGFDDQCAFNRTGLLCGSCSSGLSLSLGSSLCLSCENNWPLLFAVITMTGFLAGMALCVVILVLNLTVAVGTINGVIFYANVLAVSYSTFLPRQQPNFPSVFISWLNFEVGFDTCYLEGMDAYTKTWLQLAFPLYVFTLVLVIIKISQRSLRFSRLIGKKNPVATLSTLILLSYSKILHTTIIALSFATLHYPDDTIKHVWSPDASVEYLSGKHIALFVVALVILLIGSIFTMLLFSWQWLLQSQRWKILKWTGSIKLNLFIETYHAPFNGKHRYWMGLLLLIRSVLHLVAVANTSGNPRTILASIAFSIACLLLLKASIAMRVYKKRFIDLFETFLYFNILMLTTFTWYTLDSKREQIAIAYISVMITCAQFLLIVIYHIYKFAHGISKSPRKLPQIQHNAIELLRDEPGNNNNSIRRHSEHEGADRFHDITNLIEMADGGYYPVDSSLGYQVTRKLPLSTPVTTSVIEFPKIKHTLSATDKSTDRDDAPLLG